MTTTSGDVLLTHTSDDGEIAIVGGVVELSGGLRTSAYLSLFGGNEDDDGRTNNPRQWWGNLSETLTERTQRSRTQYLLRSIPAITGNLRKIEDAARADLVWLKSTGVATSVEVTASIPALNRVEITVDIVADDRVGQIKFAENWKVD